MKICISAHRTAYGQCGKLTYLCNRVQALRGTRTARLCWIGYDKPSYYLRCANGKLFTRSSCVLESIVYRLHLLRANANFAKRSWLALIFVLAEYLTMSHPTSKSVGGNTSVVCVVRPRYRVRHETHRENKSNDKWSRLRTPYRNALVSSR
ncbi:hypothetical protein BD310DRAFT_613664 [Dichomitus squalens]|uniref:Uncharacterized protein n=1 Tax=Dichomitus squalens TaxID=114155 RepID=A0A4Q9PQ19_9APHY|nr:hypothetical protein BD310DRAFT_613664 [Dichomitus squalens]